MLKPPSVLSSQLKQNWTWRLQPEWDQHPCRPFGCWQQWINTMNFANKTSKIWLNFLLFKGLSACANVLHRECNYSFINDQYLEWHHRRWHLSALSSVRKRGSHNSCLSAHCSLLFSGLMRLLCCGVCSGLKRSAKIKKGHCQKLIHCTHRWMNSPTLFSVFLRVS